MTALISHLAEAEVRRLCWEKIEVLEHWLRRLIDDTLQPKYGDYFSGSDVEGNRIIKKSIAEGAIARRAREIQRFPRVIDALLLDDAIDIICNPQLFKDNFREALKQAFPDGRDEARTFLKRISSPRNNLAHANAISSRQAEQIICYTNDVIESLKSYYRQIGMQETYDAPLIIRVTDSFGNSYSRSELSNVHDGGICKAFMDVPEMHLRPGDLLTLDIEIDPTYDPASYSISWNSTKPWSNEIQSGRKVAIPITTRQVAQEFGVQCRIISHRDWHRMEMGADDFLLLWYKVLPPVA